MAAGELNITIEQGATFSKTLTLKDVDDNPLNLTGYIGRGQIRENPTSSDLLASFVVTFPTPTSGVVKWVLPASQSRDIDVSTLKQGFSAMTCYYDLEIEDADGVVTRILQGKASIIPNVTRVG